MTKSGNRNEHGTTWKRSAPLRRVLHYANARPTDESWQRVVLGPSRRDVVGTGSWPRDLPPFGVESLEECTAMLGNFRRLVLDFTKLKSPTSMDAIALAETLRQRAALIPDRFGFDRRTMRLVQRWTTKKKAFEESLYGSLAFALQDVPYSWIHCCDNCERVFASESRRALKYCSPKCRNQALVRRYRARHPARTRDSHRKVMQRLRQRKDAP